MRYEDLKIGQKIFFSNHDDKVEEVVITSLNGNDEFTFELNGEIVFAKIDLDPEFNFAYVIEEKSPKNYGILYSSLELTKQEDRFYDLAYYGVNDFLKLSVENKIKLADFVESLIKDN